MYTVLPLLNISDGRPPGINGQFLCALTCFPNKWPLTGGHPRDAASGQQICAKKPLVTSDGRPVTVANVLINSCKNDAMSLFISGSAFLYSVHCSYLCYCLQQLMCRLQLDLVITLFAEWDSEFYTPSLWLYYI